VSRQRLCLVTGASRNIGRAIALELARHGHRIAVHYGSRREAAEAVAGECRQAGGAEVQVFGADLAVPGAGKQLIDEVAAAMGSVEVLVNNAGITRDTLAVRMKDEDWDAVIATNLTAPFQTARAALRAMLRAEWGRIINIASVVGLTGNPGQANYTAAKAGLIGLTKALAKEYGGKGITVNAIAPGFVESDLTSGLSEEIKGFMLRNIPAGRFGKPEDVAPLVSFLAADASAYVNGQVLTVDGGMVTS
jgi:3-oxoacyl-[acyl-carrier protein] reductase